MRMIASSIVFILCGVVLMIGCSRDIYQQRANSIKDHVEAFYGHLSSDRVAAATLENEEIEGIARQIEQSILKRQNQLAASEIDRDWMQVKSARETAVENWLALARYFVLKKRYEQAKGTYQRVLDTYQEALYRPYADRARAGIRDVDLILAPGKGS